MATTTDMLKGLMSNQLEALARIIAEKNNLEMDAVLSLTSEHASTLDLEEVTRKVTKKRAPREAPSAEHRCLARVWGDGSGNSQCKSHRSEGSDFCKRCLKKANICSTPCTLSVADAVTGNYASWKTTDGQRVQKLGLYCGRIDEPIPSVDANGIIRIIWKNDEVKAEVAKKLESGEWKKPTLTQRKKKAKKAKVPTSLSLEDEQDLEEMLSTGNDGEDEQSTGTVIEHDSVNDAFDAEEKVQVTTQREHEGQTFTVDEHDDIIDEDGKAIGTWQHRRGSQPMMFDAENPTSESKDPDTTVNDETELEEIMTMTDELVGSENEGEEGVECCVLNAQGEEVDDDYEGVTYNVAKDKTIYSDEGEEIGMWTKKGPKLFQ